jgi:hypothetical protein
MTWVRVFIARVGGLHGECNYVLIVAMRCLSFKYLFSVEGC